MVRSYQYLQSFGFIDHNKSVRYTALSSSYCHVRIYHREDLANLSNPSYYNLFFLSSQIWVWWKISSLILNIHAWRPLNVF